MTLSSSFVILHVDYIFTFDYLVKNRLSSWSLAFKLEPSVIRKITIITIILCLKPPGVELGAISEADMTILNPKPSIFTAFSFSISSLEPLSI